VTVQDGQPGDELVAAFARWAAGERVSRAASERSRQRWLAGQAVSSATWTGLLVDLAEHADPVTLAVGGNRVSGRLVGVGRDFCVLEEAGGRPILVASAAIVALWPSDPPTRRSPSGDRNPPLDISLAQAMESLAEDRVPVLIRVGEQRVEGRVWAVGEDVVTLSSGAGRRLVHLPLATVRVCEIR
jgi:hypothetical protein